MKQFNFSRHWHSKIAPILRTPSVGMALFAGMTLQGDDFEWGDPPWLHGRGPMNGQRVKEGCLSWHQPWGRCHYIAPFVRSIGVALYPNLNWEFLSSEAHTVVVGFKDDREQPECVMDILLFKKMTAEASIKFVKSKEFKYYKDFAEYAGSFCKDSTGVIQMLKQLQI